MGSGEFDVRVTALNQAALSAHTEGAVSRRTLEAVKRLFDPDETVTVGVVAPENLIRIFRRRLRRKDSVQGFPVGVEELLTTLESSAGLDRIILAARQNDKGSVFIYLSSDLASVLGCIVSYA